MKSRSDNEALQHVWVAGCAYAGLLLLIGAAGWVLQVGPGREILVGSAAGAVGVLVFSQGLYYRSIVSGFLLLGTALGPAIGQVLLWSMEVQEWESVSMVVEGAIALAGLGFSAIVIRAIYSLRSGEASRTSRHNTRFT